MAEISVHLAHPGEAAVKSPSESSPVCGAQPHRTISFQEMQPRSGGGQARHYRPGAVWRAVVDHEDLAAGGIQHPLQRRDQSGHVARLVVGRNHHQRRCIRLDVTRLHALDDGNRRHIHPLPAYPRKWKTGMRRRAPLLPGAPRPPAAHANPGRTVLMSRPPGALVSSTAPRVAP